MPDRPEQAAPKPPIVERLQAHMGKADIQDVLPDCREAADTITELLEALEALWASGKSGAIPGQAYLDDAERAIAKARGEQ